MMENTFFFQKTVIEIDDLKVLPLGKSILVTRGVLSCVAVCLEGDIDNKPHFAMTHIMAQPNELDDIIRPFDFIRKIHLIGGTDDWYGRSLFEQLKEKVATDHPEQSLSLYFNPNNIGETDQAVGVDVMFDGLSLMIKPSMYAQEFKLNY